MSALGAAPVATLAALVLQPLSAMPPLEPVGAWTAEATEAMCLVGRKFGAGDQEMTLGFRKVPATRSIRIAIWMTEPSGRPIKGNAAIKLDESASISAPFSKGAVDLKGLQIIAIDVQRDELAGLETAKILQVMAADFDRSFNIRGIGGALAALDKCENELMASWGLDPAVHALIKTTARLKNPFGLFSVNDYPSQAISKNQQGISTIRFLVSIDGRASNCGVVESSGSKALDDKSCEIYVKRGRYEPARTESGQAVSSIVIQRMAWQMPS